MDWGTLVATISGGTIAISGTVMADYLRRRHEDGRGIEARRRSVYIEFITAAGACHARLREIAKSGPGTVAGPEATGTGREQTGTDLEAATRAALSEASVYEVRERLFIDATTAVAGAGQAMFERLRALQRVVAAGAAQDSRAFHDAYHPYIEAVWNYRVAVRGELEDRSLSPATFGWEEWDGRDRCPSCGEQVAAAGDGS
ncbi:CchlQ [Streptomyces marispadix]|uniref:CchlQ n=1 Tax=Streptomyces marispadix TaxID=2922868 RepID=A0ABS9T4S5_9ACTN|nr:CchlQ [Streptomyces marispadix]MCH6163548.1 CchlQ [Streptomyces marispadix]